MRQAAAKPRWRSARSGWTSCRTCLPTVASDSSLGRSLPPPPWIFFILAPFAKVALWPVPAFIPIYQSALLVNDLITAVFLLGQRQSVAFARLKPARRRLSVHRADVDRARAVVSRPVRAKWAARCRAADHGLALHVLARRLPALRHRLHPIWARTSSRADEGRITILSTVVSIVSLVCGLALLTTLGQDLLPTIMQDNHYTPAMIIVVSAVWLLNLIALYALARRRPYSMLDLWLIVTMCAWLFDIALSAVSQRRPLRSRVLCRPDLRAIGGKFCAGRAAARARQTLRPADQAA